MEEPGGLQPMGLCRVGHDWAAKHSTVPPYKLPSQIVLISCQAGTTLIEAFLLK